MKIPCVILCGGKSSRMGRDKCFLNYKGQSLVKWQFERLNALFENVFISCKNDKFGGEFGEKMLIFDENLRENSSLAVNLNSQNANFWANSNLNSRKSEDFSPMLALYSVLKHFQRGLVFIIAVDMPFLSKNSIERLILAANEAQIILPKTANKEHFLCGLYESALYPLCLEFLQKNIHKIRLLTQKAPTKFLEFKDESEFLNLNTPQDYERIKNA